MARLVQGAGCVWQGMCGVCGVAPQQRLRARRGVQYKPGRRVVSSSGARQGVQEQAAVLLMLLKYVAAVLKFSAEGRTKVRGKVRSPIAHTGVGSGCLPVAAYHQTPPGVATAAAALSLSPFTGLS